MKFEEEHVENRLTITISKFSPSLPVFCFLKHVVVHLFCVNRDYSIRRSFLYVK